MSAAMASAYPVVPVFHPRRDARRALKRGYPRGVGSVRLCRTIHAVKRLLDERLVDAVVLDVRNCDGEGLELPARFPRIPMYVLSAVRPDDGALLASCRDAGFTGVLVEGVDNAVAPASHRSAPARRVGGGVAPRGHAHANGPCRRGAARDARASVAGIRGRRRAEPEAGH